MRIGIFGGSFNPIHNGHLRLAEEAMAELNLEKVIFVPSYATPLKRKEELLPYSLRVKLLKKAVRKYPNFSVSLCEIKRKGLSYTVDTLRYFKRKFGKKAVLYFLSGADTPEKFPRWKSFDKILKLSRFVVMTRPGYALKKIPAPLLALPFNALPISASDIRNRLKRGSSIKGLVPKKTEQMLQGEQHRFYTKN